MTRHRAHEVLWLSFFSRSVYCDVAQRWTGIGARYLVLLVTLSWIPFAIAAQRELSNFGNEWVAELFAEAPTITIRHGVVSVDPPGRHEIRNPRTGSVVGVIDVDGDLNDLDALGAGTVMLTGSKIALHRHRRGEIRAYDLARVRRFSATSQDLVRWTRTLCRWGTLLVLPFLIGGSLIYRVFQALILGGLGVVVARSLDAELPYTALVRIAAIAVTPAVLLDTANAALLQSRPAGWALLCGALNVGFVIFGVAANRNASGRESSLATGTTSGA